MGVVGQRLDAGRAGEGSPSSPLGRYINAATRSYYSPADGEYRRQSSMTETSKPVSGTTQYDRVTGQRAKPVVSASFRGLVVTGIYCSTVCSEQHLLRRRPTTFCR